MELPPNSSAPVTPSDSIVPPAAEDPLSVGAQAALDVQSLLGTDTKEYLAARARLSAHPVEATEALLDRLAAVPAPNDAEKKRLLDVLAHLGQPVGVHDSITPRALHGRRRLVGERRGET